MAASSGFKKVGGTKGLRIAGTKLSPSNSQVLTSVGVPSLDNLLGGGLAVGTVLLIEDDSYGSYGGLLMKYFVAEGVTCGHEIFLSSEHEQPRDIVQSLPCPISPETNTAPETSEPASRDRCDDLKIAWRYKNLQVSSAESYSQFGRHYDISKTMPNELLQSVTMTFFDVLQESCLQSDCKHTGVMNQSYSRLLQSLETTIVNGQHTTDSNRPDRNILRIGLHTLASSLWDDKNLPPEDCASSEATMSKSCTALCQFLYALRCLLRSSYAVCLVTVPAFVCHSPHITRFEHMVDSVIRLHSLAGREQKNMMLKDYDGLVDVVKVPRLNTISSLDIDTQDLAFKVRRKGFKVEKLRLPPDLKDSSDHSAGTVSCSSKQFEALDF